mmetsp:Transcript_19556/g.74045  ORF Transcript_19556/g.74045 Transcript_19556/m.74045 type:complete len:101 (+) Transcript_19556:1469-1771(+)
MLPLDLLTMETSLASSKPSSLALRSSERSRATLARNLPIWGMGGGKGRGRKKRGREGFIVTQATSKQQKRQAYPTTQMVDVMRHEPADQVVSFHEAHRLI